MDELARPVVADVRETEPASPTADGVLSYQSAASGAPMSMQLAKWALGLSIIPPAVGLGILGLYWLTAAELFPRFGLLWLMAGGGLAFSTGVVGIVNMIRARSRRPREPAGNHYGWATLVSLLSVPTAFGCMACGSHLVDSPHPHVKVTNATTQPIDSTRVHFNSGDVVVGPLMPGQSVTTAWAWRHHKGNLYVTVQVGTATRRKVDRGGVDRWSLKSDPFEVVIEGTELPKATP